MMTKKKQATEVASSGKANPDTKDKTLTISLL